MSFFTRFRPVLLSGLLVGTALFGATPLLAETKPRVIAYTGYLPPLSIDEAHKGIAVELMELVAEEAGIDLDVHFAPWKRAQLLAETTKGALLFSVAYTQVRREKFQYIAPLLYTESAFVTLDKPLDSIELAVATDKVIGVHLGSQRSNILKRLGVRHVEEIATAEQIGSMLRAGRIDAWYTMSIRANYIFRDLGHNPEKLVIGAPLTHGIQWLAANKDFDPALKARLSAAVSKVWRDPRYWQIVDQYSR